MKEDPDIQNAKEDQPPFLKSWNRIYLWVVIIMFSLIGLFYLFTITYA